MALNSETTEDRIEQNQPPLSIRNDLVDTAVKFLQNPKVIHSPLAQKQTFLQRRGLTEEEIRVACEKSGAYSHYEQNQNVPPLPQSPNMITSFQGYGPVQVSFFDRIREVVHNIAIFSIVAYVIHKFYQKYIAPFLFGTKKKSIEDQIDNLEKNVEVSVIDIKSSLGEVKAEVDKINYTSENELSSQLKELKSEIATVKGLLLTRKQFPSVANTPVVPPSIPAWQMSSVHQGEHETEGENEENKEELLEVGSGSGSSEPEHGMKTSESSLEIIYSSKDCDTESCHSKKSSREEIVTN